MNILALSNLFPPHYIGGYELACGETMGRLAARGHAVSVLTSNYGCPSSLADPPGVQVWRRLDWRNGSEKASWWSGYFNGGREGRAHREVRRAIRILNPDVISVWNLWSVSPIVLTAALDSGIPVVPSISDYWMLDCLADNSWLARWRLIPTNPLKRIAKQTMRAVIDRMIAPTALDISPIRTWHFYSKYLLDCYKELCVASPNSVVIYHGVDLTNFDFCPRSQSFSRLLFVGRLVPEKGSDVAIRALGILAREFGRDDLTLDLVGAAASASYLDYLQEVVKSFGLTNRVRFWGGLSRNALPAIYRSHDALLFTSIWPEPFSITLLEAMASGLPVISTATGGSGEIVQHDVNGLIVGAGDAGAIASAVFRLSQDLHLRSRLVAAARNEVSSRCEIGRTVELIEATLIRAASPRVAV